MNVPLSIGNGCLPTCQLFPKEAIFTLAQQFQPEPAGVAVHIPASFSTNLPDTSAVFIPSHERVLTKYANLCA